MANLKGGIGRTDITPPVGMLMSGYGSRTTPAQGIHDPLETVALYLSDGSTEIGLITADLIDTDAEGTARIREAAQALTGIPGSQIMVALSHTHGGPQTTLRGKAEADDLMEAYSAVAAAKMAGALAMAKDAAKPVELFYGRQDCDIAVNRRERTPEGVILGVNKAGPRGPFTDVVRIDDAEKEKILGVLFSYASHGTTLGGDNLLYTADYIGYAKRAVECELPDVDALYIAGCSGDINPYPRGTFHWAEWNGLRLGCATTQAALEGQALDGARQLAAAQQHFALPVESPPSLKEARERLARCQAQVDEELAEAREAANDPELPPQKAVDWFTRRNLRNAKKLVAALEAGQEDFEIPLEIQALAVGDLAIVGLPGEIFYNIGRAIATQSPFAHTLVISHANGSAGYIPTSDEIADGGYEIERARANRYGLPIQAHSDQIVIDQGLLALRTCHEALKGSG